jgi:hypothetical protein
MAGRLGGRFFSRLDGRLSQAGQEFWAPVDAVAAWDFARGQSYRASDSTYAVAARDLTESRSTAAWVLSNTLALFSFAANQPRIADGVLTVEASPVTNAIRNSAGNGAVAGTPGTLPTTWVASQSAGITRSVSVRTEPGLGTVVGVRFTGTAGASAFAQLVPEASVPPSATAYPGQRWVYSAVTRLIVHSGVAPSTQNWTIVGRNSGGSALTPVANGATPAGSPLSRVTCELRMPLDTTTAAVYWYSSLTNGQVYDFEIETAIPQIEPVDNRIRNPLATGVVAGSPGTVPTNWLLTAAPAGMTRTISTSVVNGISVVSVRYAGTPVSTSTLLLYFDAGSITLSPAAEGEALTQSAYISHTRVTGTAVIQDRLLTRNAASAALTSAITTVPPTGAIGLIETSIASAPANTAFMNGYIETTLTGGVAYDFTIGMGSGFRGRTNAAPTSPIVTTGTAATRGAGGVRGVAASVPDGTWTVETTDDLGTVTTTGVVAAGGTGVVIAPRPGRSKVISVAVRP